MRILPAVLLATLALAAHGGARAGCAYSAYVEFGPAVTGGQLQKKELVFRSSGLRRAVRSTDPKNNFRAVYTSYGQVRAGEFEIVNIGPYDSEAVAYAELNAVLEELRSKGYKRKTEAHGMPAVLVRNDVRC